MIHVPILKNHPFLGTKIFDFQNFEKDKKT